MQWKVLHYGRVGGVPQKALSALFTVWFSEGKWLLTPTKRSVVEGDVMKENVCPKLRSNMLNMNIPCYFVIGKPNHQEEAGLDVSTVCSLFLLEKKAGRDRTPFFLQYLSREFVAHCKPGSNRKPSTLSHQATLKGECLLLFTRSVNNGKLLQHTGLVHREKLSALYFQ